MSEPKEEAILFTRDNFPLIEYRSRWYRHDPLLNEKTMTELLSQYEKDNPDHESPYLIFAKDFPEENNYGWSLTPAAYFAKTYEIIPNPEGTIEDIFVSVKML